MGLALKNTPRSSRCWWSWALVALGVATGPLGMGGAVEPLLSGAAPTWCPSPGAVLGDVCQFAFGVGDGAPRTVSVPAGVKVTMFAAGAQGAAGLWGGYSIGQGGDGGTEQGTMTFSTATTLTVIVGDSGTRSFSGGGAYPPKQTMGTGGGGSFVFDGNTPLVIAGGGGGAGSCTSQSSCAGGNGGEGGDARGGTRGQDGGTPQGGRGGGGGSPSAGGSGGAQGGGRGHAGQAGYGPVNGPGDPHLSLQRGPYGSIGGRGGFWPSEVSWGGLSGFGGGGGGGWTGGGGGGESWFGFSGGGGGGGSGYISPRANDVSGTVGTNGGTGRVVISYIEKTPQLEVKDVAATDRPLTVAVSVRFAHDPGADGDGCDKSAALSFSDARLSSVEQAAACTYDLTFDQPGSGVYRVEAHATLPDGTDLPASVDQYGATVDGSFPVVIDSCAKPVQDSPDTAALVNEGSSSCEVAIGAWDPDSASIANEVVSDAQSQPGLGVGGQPVESVDPSDWPARGATLAEWVPTGTSQSPAEVQEPTEVTTGADDVVVLAYLHSPLNGLPGSWDGAGQPLPPGALDDSAPATVISAHGDWYTGNGVVRVPPGDTVTTYVPIGTSMQEHLGLDVDTGHVHGADKRYEHTYQAGQLVPNLTFMHLPFTTGHHVFNPAAPTTLEAVLHPHEGAVWVATCLGIYLPAGETLVQGLAHLEVRQQGSTAPEDFVSATISAGGALQVEG
jgi:hypothetical protein